MDAEAIAIRKLFQEGNCCSQILLILALRYKGEENDPLIRASSGLCLGMHSGLVCGTFSAAALALALFDPKNAAKHMIPQLIERLEETCGGQYGGFNCQDITGGAFRPDRCLDIMINTWRTVKQLLSDFGFEDESPAS